MEIATMKRSKKFKQVKWDNPFTRMITIALMNSTLFVLVSITVCCASSLSEDEEIEYLKELSIENLLQIEVTSVSKKAEKLSNAAAAVFVITNEDIRRSGATSIPEVLRMVPGLEVARIDANKWAITSRGFNGRFANKLLVLIDGRSIYSPMYSGVYWDVQDFMLEDLERIEVIRGPGATLWGANAVNGVINIISKHAKDTQGSLAAAGVGTEERGFGSIRYGGTSGEDTCYRIYAKYFNRDESVFASGDKATDDWDVLRGGFRLDHQFNERDSLTLQGDIYDGDSGSRINVAFPPATIDEEIDSKGLNVLTRWKRTLSNFSNFSMQIYYDRSDITAEVINEIRDNFDFDFQHQFTSGEQHEILWGFNYRFTRDNIKNVPSATFTPDRRHDNLWSAFVQDNISLIDDKAQITLGSKFEHNGYTGFEIQPNIRFIWKPPGLSYSTWIAVSRAVRTPSRVQTDITAFTPFPSVLLYGNTDFGSEDLLAYELGLRITPADMLFIDIAAYYNDYKNLQTFEFSGSRMDINNKAEGSTYGVEVTIDLDILKKWHLIGSYSFLQMQIHLDKDSLDVTSETTEGMSPHHQVSLRSSMDIMEDMELDFWVRYVDSLPSLDTGSYITLDVRLGWKLREYIELSIAGQNLLDSQRQEYIPEWQVIPTEVERGVYAKILWKF